MSSPAGGHVTKGYGPAELRPSSSGELYFSSLPPGVWKDWRVHEDSESRIIVICNAVTFEIRDNFSYDEVVSVVLSEMQKITIQRGVWFRLMGNEVESPSLICNLSAVYRQASIGERFDPQVERFDKE